MAAKPSDSLAAPSTPAKMEASPPAPAIRVHGSPPVAADVRTWIDSVLPALLKGAIGKDDWDELIAGIADRMRLHPGLLLHELLATHKLAEMRPVVVRLALEQCPAAQAQAAAAQLRTESLEKAERDSYLGTLMAVTAGADPDAALTILDTFADRSNIAQTAAGLIGNLVAARGAEGLDRLRTRTSTFEEYPSMLSLGLAAYAASDPLSARRWAENNIAASDTVLQKEALFSVAPAMAASGQSAELIQWSKNLPPGSMDEIAAEELARIISQGSGILTEKPGPTRQQASGGYQVPGPESSPLTPSGKAILREPVLEPGLADPP